MKKDDFYRWFKERLNTQKKILLAALLSMCALGFFAISIEAFIFFVILKIGFVGSTFGAFLVTLLISGGILAGTWLRLNSNLGDQKYEVDVEGRVFTVAVAPTMATVWTYAFGTLESDQNFAERLIGMLCLPQRLICAAIYVIRRIKEVEQVGVEPCADIVRLLFRKAERVDVETILEKKAGLNLEKTLRDVSLFDGVIFLTRKGVGLSLTTRLLDDLNEWKAKQTSSELRGDDLSFD